MKIRPVFFSILALALLGACKSATTIVENDVGIIQGNVALSVNCNALSNDSGATVQIEGTGFSATTASNGQWQINNVPAGIYNIIITKPGFDTDLISQDEFSGAGTQFNENGSLHEETRLLDSVSIVSISVTRRDSIEIENDTTIDTIVHIYTVSLTYTMSGPDSSATFQSILRDRDSSAQASYITFAPDGTYAISKGQTLVVNGTIYSYLWEYPRDVYRPNSPKAGDTIVVTSQTYTACQYGDTLSKSFVLP